MTKKMKELLDKMNAKLASAQTLADAGKTDESAADLDAADALQKDFELEERIYNAQKKLVPYRQPTGGKTDKDEPDEGEGNGEKKHFDGFRLMAKCLRGQSLTQEERELITPDDGVSKALIEKALISGGSAVSGENLLIPDDVDHTIKELRRSFQSAKEIVTVIPTTMLSGAFTWEKKAPVGLVSFEDGDDIPAGGEPEFKAVKWAISFKGAIIPLSNILSAVEAAGLTAYLNRWFVRNAIISENSDIFAALKKDKVVKPLAGLDALKDAIELDLDPDSLIDGMIVTNQTGFNRMSKAKDSTGRSYLQPDPANSARRLFDSLPIRVFSDAQLPNEAGKAPVFFGNTKSGVYFMEFSYMFFASSSHAGFAKNQTLMRVIEGYDCVEADKAAYGYVLLEVPAAGG